MTSYVRANVASVQTSKECRRSDGDGLREATLLRGIDEVRTNRQQLEAEELSLLAKLKKEHRLKNLLYGTGQPLEEAVTVSLRALGYTAENFHDGELEFDQVIVSPEGDRFIGECEGKDNAPINIDKFRQLAENIQADLQREETARPATGILFGNGFRLAHPKERPEQFTQKCLTSAKRDTILVRTSDPYPIVRYIEETGDENYKRACRDSIVACIGRVVEFPPVPRRSE